MTYREFYMAAALTACAQFKQPHPGAFAEYAAELAVHARAVAHQACVATDRDPNDLVIIHADQTTR